ncbi:MAG: hypothetical protein HY698_13710 [Deltaproteobacteria bacterium]|nr:hypothetical protein [Deltaproteobacteria bacterium]
MTEPTPLYSDTDGSTWVGTQGGAAWIDPSGTVTIATAPAQSLRARDSPRNQGCLAGDRERPLVGDTRFLRACP